MARTKDFHQIYDEVVNLEADFVTFRGEDETRQDLYSLRAAVELVEDVARDGQVDILSPDLIHEAKKVRSDLLAMPAEFTCLPTGRDERGGIKRADQVRADTIERGTAVWWGQMNRGKRLDSAVIWRQLVGRLAIVILECKQNIPPAQKRGQKDREYSDQLDQWNLAKSSWRVFEVEPLTCAFEENDDIPTLLVRRYKQLAWKTQKKYSGLGGAEHAHLALGDDGRWEWASADFSPYETRNAAQGGANASDEAGMAMSKNRLREMEMIWYDDGENIYHLALNADGKSGRIVFSGPNPVGRVSGVLVPGNHTPMRRPEDAYEPFLWPLMQTTRDLNVIETMRATTAKNLSGPQQYIALDPEVAKSYLNGPTHKLPEAHKWEPGDTPYLPGELKNRPSELSPDWEKLEAVLLERAARYRVSSVVAEDPQAAKSGTASGLMANLESHERELGPLVTNWDLGKVQLAEMMHYSIRSGIYAKNGGGDYGRFTFAATGKEVIRGKNLKQGDVYALDADTFDFPYQLEAESRQHTAAQAQARYGQKLQQYLLPDGKRGPASWADLAEAADYTDTDAQIEVLAKEAILDRLDPWLDQAAQTAASTQIEIDSGIRVPLPGAVNALQPPAPEAGAAGGPPNPLPAGPAPTSKAPPGGTNVGTTFHAPAFEGPPGGSSGVKQ